MNALSILTRRGMLAIAFASFRVTALEGAGKRALIHHDDIVGTWIGLTTDELQMVRLTLTPDGKGVMGPRSLPRSLVFSASLFGPTTKVR